MRDLSTKGTNDQFREKRVAAYSAQQMQMEITDRQSTDDRFREEMEGQELYFERARGKSETRRKDMGPRTKRDIIQPNNSPIWMEEKLNNTG